MYNFFFVGLFTSLSVTMFSFEMNSEDPFELFGKYLERTVNENYNHLYIEAIGGISNENLQMKSAQILFKDMKKATLSDAREKTVFIYRSFIEVVKCLNDLSKLIEDKDFFIKKTSLGIIFDHEITVHDKEDIMLMTRLKSGKISYYVDSEKNISILVKEETLEEAFEILGIDYNPYRRE